VYIKCSRLPKYFEQGCYVRVVLQKFKIEWRYCYVLLLVRETAVWEKREHRSRHGLDGLSRRLLLNANVTNRECLPYLRTVLETCSLHALCEEGSAMLLSQSIVVLSQSLLNRARQQGGVVQLGILKLRKRDCCQILGLWNNAKKESMVFLKPDIAGLILNIVCEDNVTCFDARLRALMQGYVL